MTSSAPKWPILREIDREASPQHQSHQHGFNQGVRDAITAFAQWRNEQEQLAVPQGDWKEQFVKALERQNSDIGTLAGQLMALETLIVESNRRSKKAIRRAKAAHGVADDAWIESRTLPTDPTKGLHLELDTKLDVNGVATLTARLLDKANKLLMARTQVHRLVIPTPAPVEYPKLDLDKMERGMMGGARALREMVTDDEHPDFDDLGEARRLSQEVVTEAQLTVWSPADPQAVTREEFITAPVGAQFSAVGRGADGWLVEVVDKAWFSWVKEGSANIGPWQCSADMDNIRFPMQFLGMK